VVPPAIERVHEQHDAPGPVGYSEDAVELQTDDLEPGLSHIRSHWMPLGRRHCRRDPPRLKTPMGTLPVGGWDRSSAPRAKPRLDPGA
jgi:hypothetical protein